MARSDRTRYWGEGDAEFEYGAGLRLNILDHEIPDPTLFENRLRITAGAQYTWTQADQDLYPWKWEELVADLTVSIVNDIEGNALYLPNSIALYVGPVLSIIRSDTIKADDKFGYSAGVEVYFTECVSFDLGIQKLDDTGYVGGLHIRF